MVTVGKRAAVRICLALALSGACSKAPQPRAADAAASGAAKTDITLSAEQIRHGGIQWAPASAGTIASSVTVPGQVVPNEDRTARLGAPAGGRVVDVRVRAGGRVAQGQVLVTLQSPGAAMAQSELAKAQAELASRRAQASYARAARERADRLLALQSIPQQDHDRAVTDDEQAQASVTQAEAELQRAQSTARQLGAGTASGEMLLRAPFAGVVLERIAVPGTVVEAGAPLVVITNPASLWLTINPPENLAGSFRMGARLRFTVPAFEGDTFTARVDGIAAGLDPATRTLAVRGLIANSAGKLRPEMLARVCTPSAGTVSVVLVPEESVVMVGGKPTVFTVMPMAGGSTMFVGRAVELGARSGGTVAIVSGLLPGEIVVTRGAFAIKSELAKGSMPAMEM
jgi:membrane fusion protein, heavy metal efflux system